jgi:hypothetical protein
MSFFKKLPGTVVLGFKGTYTESPLFELNNQVYAKHGRTYIRIRDMGHTSKDKVYWKEIATSFAYDFPLGNMTLTTKSIKAVS